DFALLRRQDHRSDAWRDEITLANENPELRPFAVFDDHLIGGQGRPTGILPTVAPLHPTAPPLPACNPYPAELLIQDPAAVMIAHQTPIGLLVIGRPVPSVVLGVHPVSDGVGPPITRNSRRNPHLAPTPVVLPAPVRFECGAKFCRDRNGLG